MLPYSILIVDDDSDDLSILQEAFGENKDKVGFFLKAFALLAYLETISEEVNMPKLIISDMNMPGVTGMDLSKALQKEPLFCHIPFIIISTSIHERNNLKLQGVSAYYQKPNSYKGICKMATKFLNMANMPFDKLEFHNTASCP